MGKLEEHWIIYREACISKERSEAEVTVIEATFYAGFLTSMLIEDEIATAALTPEGKEKALADVHEEVVRFFVSREDIMQSFIPERRSPHE